MTKPKQDQVVWEELIKKLKKQTEFVGDKDYPWAVVDIRELEAIFLSQRQEILREVRMKIRKLKKIDKLWSNKKLMYLQVGDKSAYNYALIDVLSTLSDMEEKDTNGT